jgi:transcription termination/antitermination protein NusA
MTAGTPFPFFQALRNSLTRADAPLDVHRTDLGVDDALRDIPGVLAAMLVAFGENGIRTVEDLAACATDDLTGWTEQSGAKTTTHPGILGNMAMSRNECDAIILQARIRAGWIEAATPAS